MNIRFVCWLLAMWITASGFSAATTQPGGHEGYRLGPNDVLRILVYGEEDLSIETKIEGNGHITYPLLGVLKVDGLTAQELQQQLMIKLEADMSDTPR
ncbi:MAG: polysaccharide biosynthesis/export family protein [Nitrospiraceae bacterium]